MTEKAPLIDLSKNEKQRQYFNDVMAAVLGKTNHRFFGYGGGVRGGKTYVTLFILIVLCKMFPKSKWHVIRKDMPVLIATTIPSLKKLLPQGVTEYKDKSNYHFMFPNGSQIIFKAENLTGDYNLDDFLGLETNGIFLEQAEELSTKLWQRAIERTGTWYIDPMPKGLIFLTFNPTDNWVKSMFYDKHRDKTLAAPFYFKEALPSDNPYVTADNWEIWKHLDETDYKRQIEGDWDAKRDGNEFYHAFSRAQHVAKTEYRKDLPLHITFDQNVVPYVTACVWQVHITSDFTYLVQIDEICLKSPRNTTQHQCAEIMTRYGSHRSGCFFYGDASGRKRDTRGGQNDYLIISTNLRQLLNNKSDRVPANNPSVLLRRSFINMIFQDKTKYRVIVSDTCLITIEDYMKLKQDANGGKLKEMVNDRDTKERYQLYGHTSDANDYFFCTVLEADYNRFRSATQNISINHH